MSVLLFPPPYLCRPALLTAWAAVSVAQLIGELTEQHVKIKWPNDVYLDGKKVCGILIEQRSKAAHAAPATVVGVGLNVSQSADFFAQAGLTLGGSILTQTGRTLVMDNVARQLITKLDEHYDRMLAKDLGPLESTWRTALELLGVDVIVEGLSARYEGRLLDLYFDAVVLEVDDGTLSLVPEAVRHITPR